jgi:Co/Zn/Cd efflux system component
MPHSSRTIRRLAFWSIPLAFGVMGLKFVAWYLTGSIALYSDALESIVNVIAATAAFIAIGYAQKPADISHPYGHHKAEYFSAVLEGVLIVVAALLIVHEAIGGLWSRAGLMRRCLVWQSMQALLSSTGSGQQCCCALAGVTGRRHCRRMATISSRTLSLRSASSSASGWRCSISRGLTRCWR